MKEKNDYLRALDVFETTNENTLFNNSMDRSYASAKVESVDGEGGKEETEIVELEVELQPWKKKEKVTFVPDEKEEEELEEVVLEVDMEERIKNATES